MDMIICPRCGYDHELLDRHKIMGEFIMTCNDHECRERFVVEIEFKAHTRPHLQTGDGRSVR